MDREFYNRLVDRFSPVDLVDYLEGEITTEQIIDAFEDVILDNREEIEEFISYGK